jgi:hypothetical protein
MSCNSRGAISLQPVIEEIKVMPKKMLYEGQVVQNKLIG